MAQPSEIYKHCCFHCSRLDSMGFLFLAELFRLADYYGEEDLKRRCEQQLRLLITKENFSQIYSAAVLYDFKVKIAWISLLGMKVSGSNLDSLSLVCCTDFA